MNKFATLFIGFLLALHLASMLVGGTSPTNLPGTGYATNTTDNNSTMGTGVTPTPTPKSAGECVRSTAALLLPTVIAAFFLYGRR